MRFASRTATVILGLAALVAGPAAIPAAGASGGTSAPTQGSTSAHKTSVRPSAIATWYGPGFFGSETACGQKLTPATIGVANRTLPCGTLVKVAYHGHNLVVPVIDRGPYSHIGADWDLTAGAATALGITETVRIGTRVVGSAANSKSLGQPPASQTATLAGGAVAN